MSVKYLTATFELPITGPKKPVLISLADRVNDAGYCYPSMRDIAFRAGCSERTVIRAISELEKLGFLAIIRKAGRSNKYILLLGSLSTSDATESQENVIHNSDTVTPTHDREAKKPCQSDILTVNNRKESLRARGNQKFKKENQTHPQAYKIYQPPKSTPANKQTAGQEMQHIKALLSGVSHHAK